MRPPALEVRDFSFALGKKTILKNISFTVPRGGYLSIIGPNGAGKTTLIKCLNRIYTGGTGTILVEGVNIREMPQRELAKRTAYVPQGAVNHYSYTVYEFVMMGRYPYLRPFSPTGDKDKKAVWKALSETATAELAGRRLSTLSGGESQRVFIAAALAQEAGILLLDEPAAFLDPACSSDTFRLLDSLNKKHGVTIISVTHDINSASLRSDDVLALKKGGVVYKGPSQGLMKQEILKELYGQSFLFVSHPVSGRSIVVPEGAP